MSADVAFDVLRRNAFPLVAGELVLASGLVACILSLLRGRKADPSALYFGVGAVLYGLRLLVGLAVLRAAFPTFPSDPLAAVITLVIGIPFVLFFGSVLATAYPWVTRSLVMAEVLLAVAGILAMAFHEPMESIWFLNGILVLLTTFAFGWLAFIPGGEFRREVRVLRVGVLVLCVFVLQHNLATVGLVRESSNWEPIGMLVLLGTLGYVSAVRSLRTEKSFVEITKELDIARQIQRSILPRELPASSALQVAARHVPISAVAGDFYDFVIVDPDRVGILVADVSGHGVPAALIASMVKIAITAQRPHADDPARVLSGMNRTLCGNLQGQFVTAAYLFLDAAAGRIRYGAAGHPPMLWGRRGDQRVEVVEENGLMLGFAAGAVYTFTERAIGSADRFLLYTDGVLEARSEADEFFGQERLVTTLQLARTAGAEAVASSVLDDVGRWAGYDCGRPQEDDLTVLVVDCRSDASSDDP